MLNNKNGPHLIVAAQHGQCGLRETPALQDAIAGLTGNLGIEIYAGQVDAQQLDLLQAVQQCADSVVGSDERDQEEAVAAAEGRDRR